MYEVVIFKEKQKHSKDSYKITSRANVINYNITIHQMLIIPCSSQHSNPKWMDEDYS